MPYLISGYMIGSRSICRHGLFPFESCFGLWQGGAVAPEEAARSGICMPPSGSLRADASTLAGILQGNDAT